MINGCIISFNNRPAHIPNHNVYKHSFFLNNAKLSITGSRITQNTNIFAKVFSFSVRKRNIHSKLLKFLNNAENSLKAVAQAERFPETKCFKDKRVGNGMKVVLSPPYFIFLICQRNEWNGLGICAASSFRSRPGSPFVLKYWY